MYFLLIVIAIVDMLVIYYIICLCVLVHSAVLHAHIVVSEVLLVN